MPEIPSDCLIVTEIFKLKKWEVKNNIFMFVACLYSGQFRRDVNIPHSRMTKTCWETLVTCL